MAGWIDEAPWVCEDFVCPGWVDTARWVCPDWICEILEPTAPVVTGPAGGQRGREYGFVEYPTRRKSQLAFDLVQKRQAFRADLEAYQVPEAVGTLLPVLDILAEFEQARAEFSARVRQVADFTQSRSRFTARVRLGNRASVALRQDRQQFLGQVVTRKPMSTETPARISDILKRGVVRDEKDDEEAILLFLITPKEGR